MCRLYDELKDTCEIYLIGDDLCVYTQLGTETVDVVPSLVHQYGVAAVEELKHYVYQKSKTDAEQSANEHAYQSLRDHRGEHET